MTTWTPKTENSSSWTQENTIAEPSIFSPAVFSLARFNGLLVFAIGESVWTAKTAPVGSWVAE